MNLSLLPGTIVQFGVIIILLWAIARVAIAVERGRQHEKARAFYDALNRDTRSISPDIADRDRHILRSYQTEVWGPLR